MRPLRGDLVGIPLAARLRHRIDLGGIHDRAGAIARVRPLVEDVDLIAGLAVDGLRLLAADEDSAIGLVVDPELGADLEVLVGGLGDEIGEILAVQLVGGQHAVLHRPIGLADLVPVALLAGVDQRDPVVSERRARRERGGADHEPGCHHLQVISHQISSRVLFVIRR
jgi:hypothetical protein